MEAITFVVENLLLVVGRLFVLAEEIVRARLLNVLRCQTVGQNGYPLPHSQKSPIKDVQIKFLVSWNLLRVVQLLESVDQVWN